MNMRRILEKVLTVIGIVVAAVVIIIRVYMYFVLSSLGTVWLPEESSIYIAERDDGSRMAMYIDSENKTLFSAEWVRDNQDIIGRINAFGIKGHSPNKLFDRIYAKNDGLFGLRIAPSGYNVDIVELTCQDQYTDKMALNSIKIGETYKDTWFINEDSIILKDGLEKMVLYSTVGLNADSEKTQALLDEFLTFLSDAMKYQESAALS